LAPWIIGHFPVHGCYVEPFCGAASVFLRKTPAEFEVINDLDGDVVNFFRVLRERTDEFIEAIENTPYSREEYRLAWLPVDDALERARRLSTFKQQR
jgi:DNA adenine methylase